MASFDVLFKTFESTKDISKFYYDYSSGNESTRFLLLRSLDKIHHKELLSRKGIDSVGLDWRGLLEATYNTDYSIDEIVNYIESKRVDIVREREEAEEGLEDIIRNFGTVNCGVRNDKLEDIVKALVRDKSIKSIEELKEKIGGEILPRLNNYILWSYYNQTTNDLIEHFLIENPNVIPTLRKIHDIDFFVKVEDEIIPFDLKITHVADPFFELYSKGLMQSTGSDDFTINTDSLSEMEEIKQFYRLHKKEWNLPNYGGLSKNEIIALLQETNEQIALEFCEQIFQRRIRLVESLNNSLHELEWWNYKYQGERLFCNNNRLFIFLVYRNSFDDGRPLKGNLELINENITRTLNNITKNNIQTIKYHYEKEVSLIGDYETLALSTIIIANK